MNPPNHPLLSSLYHFLPAGISQDPAVSLLLFLMIISWLTSSIHLCWDDHSVKSLNLCSSPADIHLRFSSPSHNQHNRLNKSFLLSHLVFDYCSDCSYQEIYLLDSHQKADQFFFVVLFSFKSSIVNWYSLHPKNKHPLTCCGHIMLWLSILVLSGSPSSYFYFCCSLLPAFFFLSLLKYFGSPG